MFDLHIRFRRITPCVRRDRHTLILGAALVLFACDRDSGQTTAPDATTGDIEVTSSTTGSDLDPNGYRVTLDGARTEPIDANASITFREQAAGEHEIELSDVASNCRLTGDNPRTLTVTAGTTVATTFEVGCVAVLREQIAFATGRDGGLLEIYIMDADGSNPTNLTDDPVVDTDPAISPDGTRIAFTRREPDADNIYVMAADGSDPIRLTPDSAADLQPAWSPDGTKIAFTSSRDGNFEIYVMNADGSDPVNLTEHPSSDLDPAWSPDGTKIAFRSHRDTVEMSGDGEVYVMDVDGSNPVNLSREPGAFDAAPAWSPDGTRIAFLSDRDGDSEVYVMNADGSDPRNLTEHPDAGDTAPGWSPDGSRIAFVSLRDGNAEIYVINADGSNPIRLTENPKFDGAPDWSP